MAGYGFGIGVVLGLLCGAALVRYGVGLGARLIYQVKEDMPLLGSDFHAPLEQSNTNGETDIDTEDLE